jgi:hypothetical protein
MNWIVGGVGFSSHAVEVSLPLLTATHGQTSPAAQAGQAVAELPGARRYASPDGWQAEVPLQFSAPRVESKLVSVAPTLVGVFSAYEYAKARALGGSLRPRRPVLKVCHCAQFFSDSFRDLVNMLAGMSSECCVGCVAVSEGDDEVRCTRRARRLRRRRCLARRSPTSACAASVTCALASSSCPRSTNVPSD